MTLFLAFLLALGIALPGCGGNAGFTPIYATNAPMTGGTATLAYSTDASSPSYQQVVGGTINASAVTVNFRATGGAEALDELELALVSGKADDVIEATAWSGNVHVGSATFTGMSTHAMMSITSAALPNATDVLIALRLDTAPIGVNQPGKSGELVQLAVVGARAHVVGTETTLHTTGVATGAGFRTYRSLPRFSLDILPSQGVADGRLMRFRVDAHPLGDVSTEKFTFRLAAYNCDVTNVNLFAYTDVGYSAPALAPKGQLLAANATPSASGLVTVYAEDVLGNRTAVVIPAGQARYFELRASVAGRGVSYNVATTLLGDPLPLPVTGMSSVLEVDGHGGQFVWSPNSLGRSSLDDLDWTDGFGTYGLPFGGLQVMRTN